MGKNYKYAVDDLVTYRRVGICKITDITLQNFARQGKSEYYVLSSVYDQNTKVFVPVDSELENEIKPMLDSCEINKIIEQSRSVEDLWVDDCKARAAVFENIVNSGDKVKMLWLIKRVSEHKAQMEEARKKVKATDTRYLAICEGIIASDFAYSLGLAKNQVMDYIKNY
ncbi:MAG: CarD family transcriptional regulator [Clostridia bacterium]|nr:CarD family transcriptional regulator [Clostridia bacterium]